MTLRSRTSLAVAGLAAVAVLAPSPSLAAAGADVPSAAGHPVSTAPVAPAARAAVHKPSKPKITKVKGGGYYKVTFAVAKKGGQPWTVIDVRALQVEGGDVVGSCHPGKLASRGSWVAGYPSGPGHWKLSVRVKNKAGWSAWSAYSKPVAIG